MSMPQAGSRRLRNAFIAFGGAATAATTRLTVSVFLSGAAVAARVAQRQREGGFELWPAASIERPAEVRCRRRLIAPDLALALPFAIVLPRARSVAVALALSEARKVSLRPVSLTSVARGAVVSRLPEVPPPGRAEPPEPAAGCDGHGLLGGGRGLAAVVDGVHADGDGARRRRRWSSPRRWAWSSRTTPSPSRSHFQLVSVPSGSAEPV